MTSDSTGGVKWRRATVLIRSDIFTLAEEQGIDISSECNRALAGRLGIEYTQQKNPEKAYESPVIIAKEGAGRTGSKTGGAGRSQNPVLNAEDPATPARILKIRKEPAPKVKPVPAPVPGEEQSVQVKTTGPEPEPAVPVPAAGHKAGGRSQKKSPQKVGKDNLIRQFVAERIARTSDGESDRIAKDELYQLFSRWWKANAGRQGTVPDKRVFSVFLKNRLVMDESVADGIQYWNNVRLR